MKSVLKKLTYMALAICMIVALAPVCAGKAYAACDTTYFRFTLPVAGQQSNPDLEIVRPDGDDFYADFDSYTGISWNKPDGYPASSTLENFSHIHETYVAGQTYKLRFALVFESSSKYNLSAQQVGQLYKTLKLVDNNNKTYTVTGTEVNTLGAYSNEYGIIYVFSYTVPGGSQQPTTENPSQQPSTTETPAVVPTSTNPPAAVVTKNGRDYVVDNSGNVVAKTGVATVNGRQIAVVRGQFVKVTGIFPLDGEYYYIINGYVATNVTGLVPYRGRSYYFEKGVFKQVTGFKAVAGGKMAYIYNGALVPNTGYVPYQDTYVYIRNGYYTKVTGFIPFAGKYILTAGGVFYNKYSGTLRWQGHTYKVVKGIATRIA